MLTRRLLLLGLICLAVWFIGRAALTFSPPTIAEARFPVPGEELLRGLDPPETDLGAAGASPSATATPSPLPLRTATPLPVVAPTPGCFTYTVRAGDTPLGLARRFDTPVSAILQDNQLSGTARLRPGQRLALCVGPAAQTVAALPRYRVYRAQPGDTLHGVALRFGLPVYTLAQANNLPLSARLYSGQPLRLPDDAVVPVSAVEVAAPPSAPPPPTPPAGPAPRRVPVPQATETVHLAWPRRVAADQAVTVRLGFGRTAPLPDASGGWLPSLQPTATPATVYRADRALAAAYDGVAVARLAGDGLEARLLTPAEQSLSQADMGWAWTLTPRQPGRLQAQASLDIRWTPRDGGPPIVHTVWQGPLDIEVAAPPMPGWLLNLPGLLGLGLVLLALALGPLRPARTVPPGGTRTF